MRLSNVLLQRPYGNTSTTCYCLSEKDLIEFFVKLCYKETEWEEQFTKHNPLKPLRIVPGNCYAGR